MSETEYFPLCQTKDGSLAELVRKRYQSFDTELGAQIEVTSFPSFPFILSLNASLMFVNGVYLLL